MISLTSTAQMKWKHISKQHHKSQLRPTCLATMMPHFRPEKDSERSGSKTLLNRCRSRREKNKINRCLRNTKSKEMKKGYLDNSENFRKTLLKKICQKRLGKQILQIEINLLSTALILEVKFPLNMCLHNNVLSLTIDLFWTLKYTNLNHHHQELLTTKFQCHHHKWGCLTRMDSKLQ